jgi:hypothetical protein
VFVVYIEVLQGGSMYIIKRKGSKVPAVLKSGYFFTYEAARNALRRYLRKKGGDMGRNNIPFAHLGYSISQAV